MEITFLVHGANQTDLRNEADRIGHLFFSTIAANRVLVAQISDIHPTDDDIKRGDPVEWIGTAVVSDADPDEAGKVPLPNIDQVNLVTP